MSRATEFDDKVAADATEVSTNYSAVVALSIRQALATTEITISKGADGSWNTTDVMVFMKGQYGFVPISDARLKLQTRNIQQWRE